MEQRTELDGAATARAPHSCTTTRRRKLGLGVVLAVCVLGVVLGVCLSAGKRRGHGGGDSSGQHLSSGSNSGDGGGGGALKTVQTGRGVSGNSSGGGGGGSGGGTVHNNGAGADGGRPGGNQGGEPGGSAPPPFTLTPPIINTTTDKQAGSDSGFPSNDDDFDGDGIPDSQEGGGGGRADSGFPSTDEDFGGDDPTETSWPVDDSGFPSTDQDFPNGIGGTPFSATNYTRVPVKYRGSDCLAHDEDQLTSAVWFEQCAVVLLDPDTTYSLRKTIVIRRVVTILGDPATPPMIDGHTSTRSFHIVAGGFLTMRFVQTQPGRGIVRRRRLQPNPKSRLRILRGGVALISRGALGAEFENCYFLELALDEDDIRQAIIDTYTITGTRVWGGDFLIGAGVANFIGCTFWDSTVLSALNDQIGFGGDVLVVAGEVYFTNCFLNDFLFFGQNFGAGSDVAVFGGMAVFTACTIFNNSFINAFHGIGTSLFVGGGVLILTLVEYFTTAAAQITTGMGTFTVGAGVLVMTGVSIENIFGLQTSEGAGFNNAVGAGVFVHVGVQVHAWSGPIANYLFGSSFIIGSGTGVLIASGSVTAASSNDFGGFGGVIHNGGGVMTMIGCQQIAFVALSGFQGFGGVWSQAAGYMTYIGNPTFSASALSFFAGYGGVGFLGAGSAIIGYSPNIAYAARSYSTNSTTDYWIAGNKFNGLARNIGYFANNKSILFTNNTDSSGGPDFFQAAVDIRDSPTIVNPDFSDQSTLDQLSFVPDNILQAVQALQEKMPRLDDDRTKTPRAASISTNPHRAAAVIFINQRRPALWIDDDNVTSCRYCNVGGEVAGPGAGVCEGTEVCEDLSPASDTLNQGWSGVNLTDYHLLMGTIQLGVAEPISSSTLAYAVRNALMSHLNATRDHEGVQVSVASVFLEHRMQDLLEDLTPVSEGRGLESSTGTQVAAEYKDLSFTLLTRNSELLPGLNARVDEWGGSDALYHVLKDLLADAGIHITGAAAQRTKTLVVPAYNSSKLMSAWHMPSSSLEQKDTVVQLRTVRLFDSSKSGMPVNAVYRGKGYKIQLSGFPPSTQVSLTLKSVNGQDDPVHIDGVETSDEGSCSVKLKVPKALEPGLGWYIQAEDEGATVVGRSALISVLTKRRLKRYGPYMRV